MRLLQHSAGGRGEYTPSMLQDHPEMKQQAMLALDALHQYDILHGDVASNLHNFVMSDDGQAVWLVDCIALVIVKAL